MSRFHLPDSEIGLIAVVVAAVIGGIILLLGVVPFALMTAWNWIAPSAGLPRMDLIIAICVVVVLSFLAKTISKAFARHR